ncbi:DUF4352 domain-containing protein [Actinoplanes solisilvae]|uniref:DUF4352 domain-containing protein n=1 Tax=Actinoplanes solisilvae TaxID=2486853 RepID=UPI001F0BFBBE|nr:DUF4352 domain-containing protein [Actinoplanes solisilvae]
MTHDPQTQRQADPRPRRRAPLNPLLTVLLACGAVVVLFFAGVAAQQINSGEVPAAAGTVSSPAPTTKRTTKPPPGLGDAVRDGKFEFVVTKVDCSRTEVGLEHFERTADGKYCVVSLRVRNIAKESQYFLGHAQKAFDAAGKSYGSDEIAGVYANRDTQTFLQKLDPGERVTGKLVFDVPKAVKLTSLKLHDSLLSGGAVIDLR